MLALFRLFFYPGYAIVQVNSKFPVMKVIPATETDNPHRPLTPDPALQQLTVFTGKWKVEGKNFASAPREPGMPVKGTVVYEWMAGQFFLVFRWERNIGSFKHTGMGVIGYDTGDHGLNTTNYDNLGYRHRYKIMHENNAWKFSGEYERAAIVFSGDNKSSTETWEISADGWSWKPLCELKATTVG